MGAGNSTEAQWVKAKVASVDAKIKADMLELFGKDVEVKDGGYVEGGAVHGGGKSDLQAYGDVMYSASKEKLIRAIASEVFQALRIKGADSAKSAPIKDVIAHLNKIVPNPKSGTKFTDSFNKNSAAQKSVCDALVRAINKNYGAVVIDESDSDSVKCQKVAEVMSTLMQGLHTEFMTVAGDMLRVLRNVQELNQALDASYKKQTEIIDASDDLALKNQSGNVKELYETFKAELNRQMALLANMVNGTVGPTGKSLIGLLEDNRDFVGMVRDIKADIGTNEFGTKMAYMLSGINSVAHAAEVVEKALKQLGMSVKEFKNAKNPNELRMKIYEHIQKKHPNTTELDRMMAAAEVIYKNNYNHDEVAKVIKGGCGCAVDGADEVEAESDANAENLMQDEADVQGGLEFDNDDGKEEARLPAYWSKKSLSKKIKNKEKYRNMLLKDFRKLLKGHYQMIVNAADKLSKDIGVSIPVNDDLDKFIKTFVNLPTINQDDLHVVLSGYAKDSASKAHREKFMNKYDLLLQTMEPLEKGAGSAEIKKLGATVSAMMKAIDDFSDNMVKAITDIHIDQPADIAKAVRQTVKDFYGSSDKEDDFDASLFGVGSFVELQRVKNEMYYRYEIAHIKDNLSRVAPEMATFSEGYENILGEEAGWLISAINRECDAWMNGGKDDNGDEHKKTEKDHVRVLLEQQRKAKVGMVEAAQAIDLYLVAFTNGMVNHPDSVKSVVKMLDQVEFVAKWFNERSGNNLVGLMNANSDEVLGDTGDIKIGDKAEDVEKKQKVEDGVGVNNADKMKGLLKLSDKCVKSMRALENILSVFATVGAKFGNLVPQSKTFMNPGQIFNALCDYMTCSAFSLSNVNDDKVDYAGLPKLVDDVNKWEYHDYVNRKREVLDHKGKRDWFYDTDLLFQMSVKSVVCKVLTVVDAYRLFHRPTMDRWTHDSLNPLRTIMGGADGGAVHDYVKVVPEALELYLRLPLLAEWYREMFSVKNNNQHAEVQGVQRNEHGAVLQEAWRLSIVPTMDGTWSDLIKIIFDQADYVENGNYPESQAQKIIEAINQIYKNYKARNAKVSVRDIMIAFVMEMNRSYGFLKQSDITAYLEDRRKYLQHRPSGDARSKEEDDYLNYDILNANDQFSRKATAPSDKFIKNVPMAHNKKPGSQNFMMLQKAIESLRMKMDLDFRKQTRDVNPNDPNNKYIDISFVDSLRNYKNEMNATRTDKEQYNLVLRLIQGSNRMLNMSVDIQIMLHEAVLAPLHVLKNLQGVLYRLNSLLHGCTSDAVNTGYAKDDVKRDINGVKALYDRDAQSKAHTLDKLLRALLSLCTNPNKLVSYTISESGVVNVDFSNLEDICANLLAQVKDNLNKLRIHFASTPLLNDYEDESKKGSIPWLEENLMQTLFKDRDECGLNKGLAVLANTMKNLPVDMTAQVKALVNETPVVNDANRVKADLRKFPFNVAGLSVNKDNLTDAQKGALINMSNGADIANDNDGNVVNIPALAYTTNASLNKWQFTSNSLLLAFNQMVNNYLNDNLDDSTTKFYLPLIESFMNGAAAKEVIQGDSLKNVLRYNADNNLVAGNSTNNAVLFESSAIVMRSLMNTVDMRLKKKQYSYEGLAEIPEYMKERMRVNLPYYSKLFNQVCDRSEFLRKLINNTQLKDKVNDHEDMLAVLNRITELALSIKRCADQVYKELQDPAPYFMDLRKGFIEDYKQRNGALPVMPASNVLLPQANNIGDLEGRDEENLLLPTKLNGSYAYKYNHASRVLLARSDVEPKMDHLPGAKVIYNNYAGAAGKHPTISANEYSKTVQQMIHMSRFLNDGAVYERLYNPLNGDVFANYNVNAHGVKLVYQFAQQDKKLVRVLELAENPDEQLARSQLGKTIGDFENLEIADRSQLRTFNILDMNIVPINIHAFMREVPFVNILNYSYTFDRMMHDFILPDYVKNNMNNNQIMMKESDVAGNSREVMVKSLVYPYAVNNNMDDILDGTNNMKLGVPKYLSDQVKKLTANAQLDVNRNNTKLVRNLVWVVQLQRMLRHVMTAHLSWLQSPVVQGLQIANPDITEFGADGRPPQAYDAGDFNGTNYQLV